MNVSLKTLAIAGLMGTLTTPAFADGHLDLNTMTCDEYNQLSGANRDKVAMMAIANLEGTEMATDGTATATEDSVGTSGTESTDTASTEDSAQATSTVNAGDDMTHMEEKMAILNRVCSRNWDAMVKEAAAGQPGTR